MKAFLKSLPEWIWFLAAAAFVLGFMIGVSGCQRQSSASATRDTLGFGDAVSGYRDPKTGCEYLIYDGAYAGAMVPRMSADGKQVCAPS